MPRRVRPRSSAPPTSVDTLDTLDAAAASPGVCGADEGNATLDVDATLARIERAAHALWRVRQLVDELDPDARRPIDSPRFMVWDALRACDIGPVPAAHRVAIATARNAVRYYPTRLPYGGRADDRGLERLLPLLAPLRNDDVEWRLWRRNQDAARRATDRLAVLHTQIRDELLAARAVDADVHAAHVRARYFVPGALLAAYRGSSEGGSEPALGGAPAPSGVAVAEAIACERLAGATRTLLRRAILVRTDRDARARGMLLDVIRRLCWCTRGVPSVTLRLRARALADAAEAWLPASAAVPYWRWDASWQELADEARALGIAADAFAVQLRTYRRPDVSPDVP